MEHIQKHLATCLTITQEVQENKMTQEDAMEKLNTIETQVKNTSDCSETIIEFINTSKSKITTSSNSTLVQSEISKALPIRYIPETIEGHVEPLPEHHNGLIHGALIRKKNHNLFCYAHRWFQHSSERWGKKWRGGRSTYKEEIAGLFEKYSLDGISLERPNTHVSLFKDVFMNASSPTYLDKHCISKLYSKRSGKYWIKGIENSWFYMPNDYDDTKQLNKNSKGHNLTYDLIYNIDTANDETISLQHEDTKIISDFMNRNEFYKMFYGKTEPTRLMSAPDYTIPTEATPGYVVNSPYIKVFSLGSDIPETIVSIHNAWKAGTYYGYRSSINRKVDFGSSWQSFVVK